MTQWPAFVAIVTVVIGSYFTIGLVVIAWQVKQFEQRLNLLESYPQQIRANMGPKSEQIVHDVQDCIRIQGWVRRRDVRALRARIKDIRDAMGQYRDTEKWEEKGYDKLSPMLELLELEIRGKAKDREPGYDG
jgi:Tfp pilus assembly protein PilN